ncbi:hypothetical protein A8L45_06125 [Veronia pacifica]|uniref:OmpA-like domain-containing protein n=2 Tax=Veronia pacifica TaxID=1080227 RepID=A0A1C3EMT2_9GAMM|nr:hypothetical protein A8L45_06125 [Veronia pacifica]
MKKANFKKTVLALTLALPLVTAANTASAAGKQIERDTQPQYIGVGGGAAVGVLLGGPVGAFAGALLGGLIGEVSSYKNYSYEQENELLSMNELLSDNNEQLAMMTRKYSESQIELADMRLAQHEKSTDLELQMDIQFRTNSSEIEPHFKGQLNELANIMRQNPDVLWDLEGHADVRGQKAYNMTLSEKRVKAVFDHLVSKGVAPEQLTTQAYGSETALKEKGDREGYFFDRRVSLRAISGHSATAQH